MISHYRNTRWQISKQPVPVMMNYRAFSVHRPRCMMQFSTEIFSYCLMTEADTEYRFCLVKPLDHFHGDTRFSRYAGAGRNHNRIKIFCAQLFNSQLVISDNAAFLIELQDVIAKI